MVSPVRLPQTTISLPSHPLHWSVGRTFELECCDQSSLAGPPLLPPFIYSLSLSLSLSLSPCLPFLLLSIVAFFSTERATPGLLSWLLPANPPSHPPASLTDGRTDELYTRATYYEWMVGGKEGRRERAFVRLPFRPLQKMAGGGGGGGGGDGGLSVGRSDATRRSLPPSSSSSLFRFVRASAAAGWTYCSRRRERQRARVCEKS